MTVQKQALKNANYYLYRDGHQTLEMKEKIDDYIDSLSDDHYVVVPYSSFNQGSSTDWVFDDSKRTATNSTGGNLTLITSAITGLTDTVIKGILIKAVDQDVTIKISKDDGVNFYEINYYNCNEFISEDDTLLFSITSGDNVIEEFKILYEQNY